MCGKVRGYTGMRWILLGYFKWNSHGQWCNDYNGYNMGIFPSKNAVSIETHFRLLREDNSDERL